MPRDLALSSRSYRVLSAVTVEMPGTKGRTTSAGVETVVVFPENGGNAVRYWVELNSGTAQEVAEALQAAQ